MSELRTKKREDTVMEKAQDINLLEIFNTIHNISIMDADFEDVEEAPLPGNSSYVPVPTSQKERTIKKNEAILPKQEEIEE